MEEKLDMVTRAPPTEVACTGVGLLRSVSFHSEYGICYAETKDVTSQLNNIGAVMCLGALLWELCGGLGANHVGFQILIIIICTQWWHEYAYATRIGLATPISDYPFYTLGLRNTKGTRTASLKPIPIRNIYRCIIVYASNLRRCLVCHIRLSDDPTSCLISDATI